MSTFDPIRAEDDDQSPSMFPAAPVSAAAPRPAGPAEPVEPDFLNLARRPFLNSRPVVRAASILWLMGVLLLLANVMLFWGYLSDSKEKRTELASLAGEIQAEGAKKEELQGRIDGSNLAKHNSLILFLNRQISERTFSWSLLFDRIAEAQPKDVRLNRLTPTGVTAKDAARRPELLLNDSGRVTLTIFGEAKNDEALMEFVENLFEHPSFDNPDFPRETREDEGNMVKFELRVDYLPGPTPVVVEESTERTPSVSIVEEPNASASAAPAPPPPGPSRP